MLLSRLITSVALAVPVVVLSVITSLQFRNWQWVALIFSAPVVTWGAWPFHRAALINARHRAATLETLISIGVTAAMAWSVWAIVWGDAVETKYRGDLSATRTSTDNTHIYLEVAVVITVFLLAGRFFEARAKRRAGDALRSLLALGARHATVLRRSRRSGADYVRSGGSVVQGSAGSVFRNSRSNYTEPAGQRFRHAVSIGNLRVWRSSVEGGFAFKGNVRKGTREKRLREDHH